MVAVAEIIEVPNTLKLKVSYGADGVDAAMLERADALMANLQGDFIVWVQEDLKKLQEHFDAAAALPVAERGHAIKEVFGVLHNMKGQGGSFGYPLVTSLANMLCRFMETRTSFAQPEMDVIHVCINALRLVVAERMIGDGGPKGEKLFKGIELMIAKFKTA
jgi:chemotaxis protein histidine kinase CheA